MSVEVNRDSVFVDMRLTSLGRQLAALGRLRFAKVAVSDKEIDYGFENHATDLGDNFVISPFDTAYAIAPFNLDGSPAIPLGPKNLIRGLARNEANFFDHDFFTSGASGWSIHTPKCFALGNSLASNLTATNQLLIENIYRDWPDDASAQGDECVGQLLLIRYVAPSAVTPVDSYNIVDDGPYVSLWYRINAYNGGGNYFTLDRKLPNFASGGGTDYVSWFVYPWDAISTFYASATTADTQVWNMNIVRTNNVIGSAGTATGYTSYGSVEYNGAKHMLGFDVDYRAIGIIHDGNPNLDVDGIERLEISATTLHLPTILWHRKPEFVSGNGTKGGHSFTDRFSKSYYDPLAKLYYSILKDGTDSASIEVGRVYSDLRMIVITHPELLAAMSYKSNRNWTLPPLEVSMEPNYFPEFTGLCESDKVYLVTYQMAASATYSTILSFSYRSFLHCEDISTLYGIEGGPYLLKASVSANHFPYMRSAYNIDAFSGTGWNANSCNILIKEIPVDEFSGLSHVSHTGWKRIPGGGAYAGESIISASGLTNFQFVITRDDYNSASDYTIGSEITGDETSRSTSGLSYGDESFFFGSITYDLVKDPECMSIKFPIIPDQMNSTKNPTFTNENSNVYITGLYILDDIGRLVATAKPSRPILKNYYRYLEFKLDLIY